MIFNDEIIQNDVTLGYSTGIKPHYYVVEEMYLDVFEMYKKESPAI